MTTLREAAQMALDVLEKLNKDGWILADFEDEVCTSIEALRAALAQPEPYPENFIDALRFDAAQFESVIYARKEGDLIVADLPQVPRGSGGISKEEL